MGAIGQHVPAHRRGLAAGIVNAGGSTGQLILAPIVATGIAAYGWMNASYGLALLALATLPLAWVFRRRAPSSASVRASLPESSPAPSPASSPAPSPASSPAPSPAPAAAAAAAAPTGAGGLRAALRDAAATPSYWYLMSGFFVCGFHIAFLVTHLPGVIELCGLPPALAGTSLAVIGLFNIAGSVLAGLAVQRWSMKWLLAALYASRGLGVALFMLAPKTELTFLVFSVWMGVTFLATVPPTAGLVGKLFGMRYMATLFAHQIGGFFGAWLGGLAFDATGSYDWMWYADIALAVFAALINLPIRESRPAVLAPA